MNEQEAIAKMVAPGARRPGKWRQGVIQIWVTRACDKSCFNCTQFSNLRGNPGMMNPEQFEQACLSLKGYFGVVGMFGGNPAIHPRFEQLCDIMQEHVPFEQRGLWSNNPLGHGKKMRETFNPQYSNLNVHLDQQAYVEFKRDWPECHPVGLHKDSRHAPAGGLAMMDVIDDESERWDLISDCDINKHWSAMICVFRGELRALFCEIAGAMSMLHQYDPDWPDLGVPVVPGWWEKPLADFADQVRYHCHRCGVPLDGYGELAQARQGKEQTTLTHADLYKPKTPGRLVELVTDRKQVKEKGVESFVDYIGNSTK